MSPQGSRGPFDLLINFAKKKLISWSILQKVSISCFDLMKFDLMTPTPCLLYNTLKKIENNSENCTIYVLKKSKFQIGDSLLHLFWSMNLLRQKSIIRANQWIYFLKGKDSKFVQRFFESKFCVLSKTFKWRFGIRICIHLPKFCE